MSVPPSLPLLPPLLLPPKIADAPLAPRCRRPVSIVACEPALSGYLYGVDHFAALCPSLPSSLPVVLAPGRRLTPSPRPRAHALAARRQDLGWAHAAADDGQPARARHRPSSLPSPPLLAHTDPSPSPKRIPQVGSALEHLDMDRLIREVGEQVAGRLSAGTVSVDDVARELHERLLLRGEEGRRLRIENICASGSLSFPRLASPPPCSPRSPASRLLASRRRPAPHRG